MAKKNTKRQTGKQTKTGRAVDKTKKAKLPGKRVSASGKTYTERRKNRSDKDRRKRL